MTEPSPEPGAAGAEVVLVELRGNPPRQWHGAITRARPNALAVRIVGEAAFAEGEDVLCLTAGRPRMAVRARFLAAQGEMFAFQLLAEWQTVDARDAERYPVALKAEVRSVLGTSRQTGSLVDISATGAAVVVAARPGGRQLEVSLSAGGYAATLPCELVSVREHDESVTLYLSFEGLLPAQQAFVRQVIAVAQAARIAAIEAAS